MAQPNPFDLLLDQVRQVVREELAHALRSLPGAKDNEPEAEWLRAEELAKKFHLPKTLFEEKGREGKIKLTRPGRHILFNVRDVERYLQSCAVGGGNNGGKDH